MMSFQGQSYGPDIYLPKTEFPLLQLLIWSLKPPPPETLHALFTAGEKCAEEWILKNLPLPSLKDDSEYHFITSRAPGARG